MKKELLFCIICAVSILTASRLVTAQGKDDYGADAANKRFIPSRGLLGGRTDFEYMNLENHPGNSGVPLGGIGCGNVEFAPDGRFVRIGMNNIHQPVERSKGAFFAIWEKTKSGTAAQRLVRDGSDQYGMPGVKDTYYKGLFPTAELSFSKESRNISPKILAYSGLIPHDIKNSSLPVVYFDVELEAEEAGEVSIAFSWEDFIGRGIREPESLDGMDGQLFYFDRANTVANGEGWPERKPDPTFSEAWSKNNLIGVKQFTEQPIIPIKATFQNYINQVVLLAEQNEGTTVSVLPTYNLNDADAAWSTFKNNGAFIENNGKSSLSSASNAGGSAIAVKTDMKSGEKKTIRFMLVWYCPELAIDKKIAVPGSYWPGCSGYGKYFHNYFTNIDDIIKYGHDNRQQIYQRTKEWQEPIIESTLPDWYKFKLINSAYVIYTNMILNKNGDMTVNEGGMGGLAGTMDQRLVSHPFYQKFFTELDRSEMDIFADAQRGDGAILHFIGHYYDGMGTVGGRVPTENAVLIDNTAAWIIQLAKDYQQTGDKKYLNRYIERVKNGMSFLKSQMPSGIQIPVGPTTYDDFKHPPVYSFFSGLYLATLNAAEVIANSAGDRTWAGESKAQFKLSQADMIKYLWNGRFFSYGCQTDGTDRLDNIMFTGQLGGQFISRYCGWGDAIPLDLTKASLVAQFKTSLGNTPDYYANKVWDLNKNRGIDIEGSQCWPFYLESYTAYPAIQAGYVDDGLDIMKHIQLVHLRKGWTWCQNLWNPGELTYMTSPVTWFSTDVIAGAGINIPEGELRLAPVLKGKEKLVLPLYYPKFWATAAFDPATRKASLKITKVFGEDAISFNKLVIEQSGKKASDRKVISIDPFLITKGAVLDLSKWWDSFCDSETVPSVLTRTGETDFIDVDTK